MTAAPRPGEPHPELDTLADLDAGVLADTEAERVRAHAAGCARCGQVLAALGGVRADLRALPAPPLPAAVAARLDATLADLRTSPEVARPAGATAGPPAPVADLSAARDRRQRRLKVVTGAAAAVVALAVAGVSVTALARSVGSSDGSAAGGGSGSSAELSTTERQDSADAPGMATPDSVPSLPDFDRSTLRSALGSIVALNPVAEVAAAGPDGPAGALADPARRTACVRTIPGATGQPTAVRWIRYAGRPAYVLVFVEDGVRTAYVVGDQCGRAAAGPATVLDTVR